MNLNKCFSEILYDAGMEIIDIKDSCLESVKLLARDIESGCEKYSSFHHSPCDNDTTKRINQRFNMLDSFMDKAFERLKMLSDEMTNQNPDLVRK
jgi:hypothetical protein